MPRLFLTALLVEGLGAREKVGYSGIWLRTFFLSGEGEGPGRVRDPALASSLVTLVVVFFVWRVSFTNVSCLWCTLAEWLGEAPARSTNQPRRVHADKHDVLGNRTFDEAVQTKKLAMYVWTTGRDPLKEYYTAMCSKSPMLTDYKTGKNLTKREFDAALKPASMLAIRSYECTTYYYYVVCWTAGHLGRPRHL